MNIKATYHDLAQGSTYEPFPGIVLTDTFQSAEDDDLTDTLGVFGDNNQRAIDQNSLDIRVIIGNPPYSAGQDSANDNNQNMKYRYLDAGIAATYAAKSTAQNKNSLCDSYIRGIRWSSDRIKDSGVVAFVSNGGYLDGNTADGLRKSLTEEFSSLYILNLRGNQRTSGEQSRREGGKVFGSGSRATVAIAILVKNPDATEHGQLYYRDIGDYLTREQKLALVTQYGDITGVPWQQLHPNAEGDWINQCDTTFASFTPIGDKANPGSAVFRTYSAGLKTNRDAWVYNSSRAVVLHSTRRMVDFYNRQVDAFAKSGLNKDRVDEVIDYDASQFSWDRADKPRIARGEKYQVAESALRVSAYRPFNKQHVYFDRLLNNTVYQLPKMFPTAAQENVAIYIVAATPRTPSGVAMVDAIPDVGSSAP